MERNISLIIGCLIILFGLVLLIDSFNLIPLTKTWPTLLMLLGIGFLLGYSAKPSNYGMLMPAAVLITCSIPLLICSVTGEWVKMAVLWPVIQLGPAIGFLAMYFAGPRDSGLLIPGIILTVTALIMLFVFNYNAILWSVIFILTGIVLILTGLRKKRSS